MSFWSMLKSHRAKTALSKGRKGIRFGSVLKKILMPHTMLPHNIIKQRMMQKAGAPQFLQNIL